jgi:hypothetical protein
MSCDLCLGGLVFLCGVGVFLSFLFSFVLSFFPFDELLMSFLCLRFWDSSVRFFYETYTLSLSTLFTPLSASLGVHDA